MAVALVAVSYLARAVRLYDQLAFAHAGWLPPCLRLMLLHNFFNNLLPMRAGEASFLILLQRYFSIGMSVSGPALLWFRLLDLYVLLLVFVFVMAGMWWGTLVQLLCLLFWIVVLLLGRKWVSTSPLFQVTTDTSKWRKLLATLADPITVENGRFFRVVLWSLACWVAKLSAFVFVLSEFITVSASELLPAVILGELSSVLPVHGFAGAGTYEAGVSGGLVSMGIPLNDAITASVNLHLFLLGSSMLSALVGLMIKLPSSDR